MSLLFSLLSFTNNSVFNIFFYIITIHGLFCREIPLAEMFAKCYHADTDIILLANVLKNGFVMTPVNRPHTFYQAE